MGGVFFLRAFFSFSREVDGFFIPEVWVNVFFFRGSVFMVLSGSFFWPGESRFWSRVGTIDCPLRDLLKRLTAH